MDSVGGSRSVDKTACSAHNVQCDPCSYKGSANEARTYCGQCEEFMCVSCASTHNSLKMTRDHVCTTVTGSDLPSSEKPGKKKHALSYCSKHGDKEIKWFCEKHEAMFCDTCKRNAHRKCQVMSVSDMKSSVHGQSLDDVITSLLSLKCKIAELKSDREKSAEDLVNFKTSCKDAVQQVKSSIIEKLDRLAKEILADIEKVVNTETVVIQDHVQTCDSLIRDVNAELTTADGAITAADDVASVVAAYELEKTLNMLEPTVSGLEGEAYHVHITFQPSSKLTDVINGVYQLGTLDIDRIETLGVAPSVPASGSPGPVSGRKSLSDMEVVSSTDLSVPSDWISGSAVMSDGRIMLADYSNKQIILLDPDFTVHSALALPSEPWDVALFGDNAAVVTLPNMKQLQYIHVDTTLRAGNTIQTGLTCCGVAVSDGQIYVAMYDDDDGEVQVLDARGTVTRSIGLISGQPLYIAVGRGGVLYITDLMGDNVTCFTNAGDVVYNVKHEGMSGTSRMVVDEDDNLLVCCYDSNDIHVMGKDGAHHGVILTSADGVVKPRSVSYRRSDQTLIVTMENTPSCRAYKLK